MRAILFVLLCMMVVVIADLLEDVIQEANIQNGEPDELSSVAEVYPRFISDVDFNRRRRGNEVEHSLSDNDGSRTNARRVRHPQKRKRRLRGKHEKSQDRVKLQKKRRKKKRTNNRLIEQIGKPESEAAPPANDQGATQDLTTCIVISEEPTESGNLTSTTPEIATRESQISSITQQSTPDCSPTEQNSTELSDISTETSSTASTSQGGNFEDSTNLTSTQQSSSQSDEDSSFTPDVTEFVSTESTSTAKVSTEATSEFIEPSTTSGSLNTNENDTKGTKMFNIKLVCKIEDPEDGSGLQKVYQCYFGSSDLISFYMPTVQKAILTQDVGDSFPTISPGFLPGNHTWRLIEASGMRTRIIEKTNNGKKESKNQQKRIRRKHRLKRKKQNSRKK